MWTKLDSGRMGERVDTGFGGGNMCLQRCAGIVKSGADKNYATTGPARWIWYVLGGMQIHGR